jgi:hypothetical protein
MITTFGNQLIQGLENAFQKEEYLKTQVDKHVLGRLEQLKTYLSKYNVKINNVGDLISGVEKLIIRDMTYVIDVMYHSDFKRADIVFYHSTNKINQEELTTVFTDRTILSEIARFWIDESGNIQYDDYWKELLLLNFYEDGRGKRKVLVPQSQL